MKHNESTDPLRTVLERLVRPAFDDFAFIDDTGSPVKSELERDDDGRWSLCGIMEGQHLLWASCEAIDRERTMIRMTISIGVFINNYAERTLVYGAFLDGTNYHVRLSPRSTIRDKLDVGCDLVVRSDDAPLVYERVHGLLHIGHNLEHFCSLYMPDRIYRWDLLEFENVCNPATSDDLSKLFAREMSSKERSLDPYLLIRMAQGLGRWRELITLVDEHIDHISPELAGRYKSIAHRELGEWVSSIQAARDAGIRNGSYPGDRSLDPAYVHALIEGGEEIEALRILGLHEDDEPFYYMWLRGLALHKAGDIKSGKRTMMAYLSRYPGDVMALATFDNLYEDAILGSST